MRKARSGKKHKEAEKKALPPEIKVTNLSPPSWLAGYSDDYYESVLQQRHTNEDEK